MICARFFCEIAREVLVTFGVAVQLSFRLLMRYDVRTCNCDQHNGKVAVLMARGIGARAGKKVRLICTVGFSVT
jgi:hypothetical protein